MAVEPTLIGRRLRELRDAAGLSQQALAVRAGLSVSVVSQIEQDKKEDVMLSTALALARALGVPVESLVEETPPRRRRK
jgi:transcriptional regulator with XRE-family HTH domain